MFGGCHSLQSVRFSLAHSHTIWGPVEGYAVESKVDKVFKLCFKRFTNHNINLFNLRCQAFCRKYNKEGFQSLPANLECC